MKTFLKKPNGQATVEAAFSILLCIGVITGGLLIGVAAFNQVVLKKWAAENSRCLALGGSKTVCHGKTMWTLNQTAKLGLVWVTSRETSGVYRTEISAKSMGGLGIKASYDMMPQEYKQFDPPTVRWSE